MDRINEQLYQANIELVDRNKLLEEDKKILIKRINRALKYIEEHSDEPRTCVYGLPKFKVFNGDIEELANILKGRYVEDGD